ncbi:MAG: hypothetical protein AB4058_15060 [Microcystaceae cyanobacterium]
MNTQDVTRQGTCLTQHNHDVTASAPLFIIKFYNNLLLIDSDVLKTNAVFDDETKNTDNITDNSLWSIDDDVFKTNSIFDFETQNAYSIRVQITDSANNIYSESFTVNINQHLKNGVIESDYDALVALYNSTNGDNWDNNTNWLSDQNVANWYGVSVTGNRVTSLDLDWNQLTGEIPPELGNLLNLSGLYLNNNQLTGEIPPELGNLSHLSGLYLNNNQLTGEIPSALGNLLNLDWLYLYDNQLTGEIPPELGNLLNLSGLFLNNNQLRGEIPPELGNLLNLYWLDLSSNPLTGDIPPELAKLSHLYGLYTDYANHPYSESLTVNINKRLKNGVIESDYDALVALYNSTNGGNWDKNTNWLSDQNVADWYGVSVTENRVNSLDLNYNQLFISTNQKKVLNLVYFYQDG